VIESKEITESTTTEVATLIIEATETDEENQAVSIELTTTSMKERTPHDILAVVANPHGRQTRSQTKHLVGSIALGALSAGSRCEAKFTDGYLHPGSITKVSGEGLHYARSSVFFDGWEIILDNITWTDINPEKQLKEDIIGDHSQPPADSKLETDSGLSPVNLHERRCKSCVMCKKKDCGVCQSCRNNKQDHFVKKQVCFLKVSGRITVSFALPLLLSLTLLTLLFICSDVHNIYRR
jgi:hypothetical protein